MKSPVVTQRGPPPAQRSRRSVGPASGAGVIRHARRRPERGVVSKTAGGETSREEGGGTGARFRARGVAALRWIWRHTAAEQGTGRPPTWTGRDTDATLALSDMSSPGPGGPEDEAPSADTRAVSPTKPSPFSVASLLADTRPSGGTTTTSPFGTTGFAIGGILQAGGPREAPSGLALFHGPSTNPFGWTLAQAPGAAHCTSSWFGLSPHHVMPSE
ncbi:unnamed protein product [Ixodes pacificus]